MTSPASPVVPPPIFSVGDKVRVTDIHSTFFDYVGLIIKYTRNRSEQYPQDGEEWLYEIRWINHSGKNILYERRLARERERRITFQRKPTQT